LSVVVHEPASTELLEFLVVSSDPDYHLILTRDILNFRIFELQVKV